MTKEAGTELSQSEHKRKVVGIVFPRRRAQKHITALSHTSNCFQRLVRLKRTSRPPDSRLKLPRPNNQCLVVIRKERLGRERVHRVKQSGYSAPVPLGQSQSPPPTPPLPLRTGPDRLPVHGVNRDFGAQGKSAANLTHPHHFDPHNNLSFVFVSIRVRYVPVAHRLFAQIIPAGVLK